MTPNIGMTQKEQDLFDKVRALLTPELIPDKFQDGKIDNPMYGHCYHATLALSNLLGGKDFGYKIKCGVDTDDIKHYWIMKDDRIIDPTSEQYTDLNRTPPYDNTSRCDYRPSKATKALIEALS